MQIAEHISGAEEGVLYLVIELSDVLFYVWQEASEGKLLDELSDVVMVIEGEEHSMAPCSTCCALCISGTFLHISVNGTDGVQAPRAALWVQLKRMALQTVRNSVW